MKTVIQSLSGLGLSVSVAVALGMASVPAQAGGGHGWGTVKSADGQEDIFECSKAPINYENKGSLQRGATMFMN